MSILKLNSKGNPKKNYIKYLSTIWMFNRKENIIDLRKKVKMDRDKKCDTNLSSLKWTIFLKFASDDKKTVSEKLFNIPGKIIQLLLNLRKRGWKPKFIQ